jgi:hypothetical protein
LGSNQLNKLLGEAILMNKSEDGLMQSLTSRMSLVLLSLLLSVAGAHADQFQAKPWEDRGYEDHFNFKPGSGTYTVDPWVWAYTPEFADKFRMPKKWIDKDLKGILAVAFRMTTIGNMNCGYGGKEDNCWPVLECQLDVYYDNRIKLPWTLDEVKQDFLMRGVSSKDFLHDLSGDKGYKRYAKKDPSNSVFARWGDGVIQVGKYRSGAASPVYFDREYQPGIGLIGWVGLGVCPDPVGVGRMNFYDLATVMKLQKAQIRERDAKPTYTFEFSESFMRRANALYEAENKQNREVAQRLIKQFFESRKAKTTINRVLDYPFSSAVQIDIGESSMARMNNVDLIKLGAEFSERAYGKRTDLLPSGWVELLSIDKASGYQAKVYVNHTTHEIFYANTGTNDGLFGQDAQGWSDAVFGPRSPQFQDMLLESSLINDEVKNGGIRNIQGYTVYTTGHSWGELMGQAQTYTFGWTGVGYDGPGAGLVVSDSRFSTMLQAQNITAVGGTDFITVDTTGLGPMGGAFIGDIGANISGTAQFNVTLPSSSQSGAFNIFTAAAGGVVAGLPGIVLGGVGGKVYTGGGAARHVRHQSGYPGREFRACRR